MQPHLHESVTNRKVVSVNMVLSLEEEEHCKNQSRSSALGLKHSCLGVSGQGSVL